MPNSLESLFYPKSIAVLGVSRDPKGIGHKILLALRNSRYPFPLYAINPKATEVASVKAYASLKEVSGPVDLAIVAVPASQVLAVVEDCRAAHVKGIVVISAGFAEAGEAGRKAEKELLEKVRACGIRMVGPNCFGILSTDPECPFNGCFSPLFALPGSVAMASQSGAMGIAILGLAKQKSFGLSKFVSMGNKADVSSNDLIEYWEGDPKTRVILLYLESLGNPARFAKIASRVSRTKPIVALKSGRTDAGSRAAGSHTAALAASDVAVSALFHQAGVLRVDTVEEMFQLAVALDYQPLPSGRNVAVLTNAGGPAILCTDACEVGGLKIGEFSPSLQERLREFLPPTASVKNPVDMIAAATPLAYERAIELVLSSPEVDAVIVMHTVIDGDVPEGLFAAISSGVEKGRQAGAKKPVLVSLIQAGSHVSALTAGAEKIPVFGFPEEPARALSRMYTYAQWKARPVSPFPEATRIAAERVAPLLRGATAPNVAAHWLTAETLHAVLQACGIPTLGKRGIALNADDAAALAKKMGFPVAVKVSSQTISHKTDVGGVLLNLKDEPSVRQAVGTIRTNVTQHVPDAPWEGVLVQPMAKKGTEVFIGMVRDPLFGPLIGFGLGGIFVEVLSDIRFRVAPLSEYDANDMIRDIKGFPLLEGFRGAPAADISALRELLLTVSVLSQTFPEIQSLDLNPVVAYPPGEGCVVLDARVQLKR